MRDSPLATENWSGLSRRQWLAKASTTASFALAGCLFTDEGVVPPATDSQSESDTTSPSMPSPDESANDSSQSSDPSQLSLDVS